MSQRFNPTVAALLKQHKTHREHTSKTMAKRAALEAIGSSPPTSRALYDHEAHLISTAQDELSNPAFFASEVKFDAVLGAIGVGLLCVPLMFGLLGATLLLFGLGVVMLVHVVDAVFLKYYPAHIDEKTIADSKTQLNESGEKNRKPISLLGSVVIIAVCGLEGFLNADSVVAILGESRMTPSMVKTISFGLTILIAYGLYKSMQAYAKEKRENDARKTIRNLEQTDSLHATKMKSRLGPALQGQYAPVFEKKTKQYQFWTIFILISVLSLGLRIGYLLMPHKDESNNSQTHASENISSETNITLKGK